MKGVKTIQDLSPSHITQLAQLLVSPLDTQSHSSWLLDQAQHITTLPSPLRKRPSLFSSLAPSSHPPQDKASLCAAHRCLNAYLIRHIFLLLSAECTTRLTRLVENQDLPPTIRDFVRRLHAVNALWMTPGLYHLAFGAVPVGSARRERVRSGCEACILAAVGGDEGILSDLRASLLGRKKKRCAVEGLLPLVEAWIRGRARGDEVFAESGVLGEEILRCRRDMQKVRRRERRDAVGEDADKEGGSGNSTLESGDSGGADIDEYDFEGSIINFYANLLPARNLVLDPHPAEDMHPAFRNSVHFPSTAGAICGPVVERLRRSSQTVYSESIYSTSGGFANLSLSHDTTSTDGEDYTNMWENRGLT